MPDVVSYSCYDKLPQTLWFKTIQICPQNFGGLKFGISFRAKVKIQAGLTPSGGSGRRICFFAFFSCQQPPVFGLWPLPPFFKASFHHHISLSSFVVKSPSVSLLEGHLMITLRTPKIIQVNLPISKSLIYSHLQNPCCHINKHSQVLKIRMWMFWGAIILSTTQVNHSLTEGLYRPHSGFPLHKMIEHLLISCLDLFFRVSSKENSSQNSWHSRS